jgi:E3 ubiquitin-protein ligase SHPRH
LYRADANSHLGTLRTRIRSALEMEHVAIFFCANAHFQIKSNEAFTEPESVEFERLEKLETEGYESAKKLRREILQEVGPFLSSFHTNFQSLNTDVTI